MRDDGERRPDANGAALENTNRFSEPNNYKEADQALQAFQSIIVDYIRRRWAPIPIPTRAKAPKIRGWPTLRIKETDAPRYFDRLCNIGIILGAASGGLVDIDLDCPEAIELAPKHLPPTGATFGRASKPSSHWLYHVEGSAPTIKLKDPLTGKMLVELRSDGGQQTVFPGSIHESGEAIEWVENGEPATVDDVALCQAAKTLAAACLIRRYLPEAEDQDRFHLALSTCDPKLANCLRDWLKIGRPSEVPRRHHDRDHFGLKGPPPGYLLDQADNSFIDRLAASLAEGGSERPASWSAPIAEACAQMRELRDNAANQGRDSWWPCLGVLAFCEDGDQCAHVWGAAHPKYSAEETQHELDGWRRKAGPPLCETFDRRSPGICGKCPHRGEVRSPISLGMRRPEPTLASDAPSLVPTEIIETQSPGMLPSPLGIEARSESIEIIGGDELLATTAPPRRWFVEKFVPAGETTMLGGDGGIGKTTLALQLSAAAGVSGDDWIGLKVNPCNVLYISAEDPKDEIHFRLEQITKHAKLPAESLARFKLIDLAGKDATIATFTHGLIKPTPLFDRIESLAREHRACCIIFDSVADFFGGNENERREVRAFVGLLRGLAMRLDAAVIFLAHPSVDGIKTGRGYSGSTHWNNAVRSRLYFTEADREEGQPPNPDLRMIELAKSNRARRGEKIYVMWTDGRFVETSAAAAVNSENEAGNKELFLRLLSKQAKQGMYVSSNRSSTYAPTAMAKMPASNGVGKAALERAMHQLLDKGKIRVEAYGPPSKLRHRLVAVEGNTPEGG